MKINRQIKSYKSIIKNKNFLLDSDYAFIFKSSTINQQQHQQQQQQQQQQPPASSNESTNQAGQQGQQQTSQVNIKWKK